MTGKHRAPISGRRRTVRVAAILTIPVACVTAGALIYPHHASAPVTSDGLGHLVDGAVAASAGSAVVSASVDQSAVGLNGINVHTHGNVADIPVAYEASRPGVTWSVGGHSWTGPGGSTVRKVIVQIPVARTSQLRIVATQGTHQVAFTTLGSLTK